MKNLPCPWYIFGESKSVTVEISQRCLSCLGKVLERPVEGRAVELVHYMHLHQYYSLVLRLLSVSIIFIFFPDVYRTISEQGRHFLEYFFKHAVTDMLYLLILIWGKWKYPVRKANWINKTCVQALESGYICQKVNSAMQCVMCLWIFMQLY